MPLIQVIPDAMRQYARKLDSTQDMLPEPARLEGFYGPRAAQYDAVAPVDRVLDDAPRTFNELREELRRLLSECATAFTEAAAILEGADEASRARLSTLTAEVESAVEEDPSSPAPTGQRGAAAAPPAGTTAGTTGSAPADVDGEQRRGGL